jgi:hypothetical protein
MTYTFLLLDLFLLLLPFCFFLDRKIFGTEMLRSAILPSLIATIIFSEVAVFFSTAKIWNYNPAYVIGSYYRQLPIEGYLFVFAYSFSGLAIYNYLNGKFPNDDLQKHSLALSNLLLGIFVAALFFAYAKLFSLVTVAILLILLLGIEYFNKLRFMYRFYRAYAVCLILFYGCYALICNLPIIEYNQAETVGINLANIPFENHFYTMGILLLGVYITTYLKHRAAK